MRTRFVLASSLCLILPFAQASAAAPRESLVVSAAWLARHLADKDLVLLHVGDKPGYDAGHIAGARFVSRRRSLDLRFVGAGLTLEMPAADDLRHRLEGLGISDRSRVVVYFGKDWVSPTTRVLFTLDYAGLGERSSLLDGGMEQWIATGHKVTVDVPAAARGTLSPLAIKPIVVDAAYVRAHLATPGVAIVDGRDASLTTAWRPADLRTTRTAPGTSPAPTACPSPRWPTITWRCGRPPNWRPCSRRRASSRATR